MNRYILIRRLRGPVVLLLVGTIALLHSMGVVDNFWRWFWPLLLISLGLLLLAERAVLASDDGSGAWPGGCCGPTPGAYDPQTGVGVPPYQGQPYPGQAYPGQAYPGQPYSGQPGQAADQQAAQSTSMVPVGPHDLTKDSNGGQS